MIRVKIIGSNCKNGAQLYKNLKKAINNMKDKKIEIIKTDTDTSFKRYNIKNKPALIIDEQLISQGKVLNARELCRLLSISFS